MATSFTRKPTPEDDRLELSSNPNGKKTSAAPESEIDQFYDQVLTAINDVSQCTWLIVMGDFNAKIGQSTDHDDDVMGKFGFGIRNERGKRLLEFARQNQLFIANTMFKKKNYRRHTWSISATKNEIDFIMIRKDQKKLVKNIEVMNRFDYKSDHRLLRMTMTLKVIIAKRKFFPHKIVVDNDERAIKEFREKLVENRATFIEHNATIQVKYD